jgi:hypothetical protein
MGQAHGTVEIYGALVLDVGADQVKQATHEELGLLKRQ